MNAFPKQLVTIFVIASVLFGGSFFWLTNPFGIFPRSLENYADEVIHTCAVAKYTPSCYDTEIPKLMDKGLSMEDAFAVTKIVQDKVGNYYYCHVLGHNLAAKETAKDPTKWTEVVARCPAGMCSNGCLHGAAQERFRDDVLPPEQVRTLVPELASVCESGHGRDFTGLEQASCYHSLGHLTMYITGADTKTAVNVCDSIMHLSGNDDYAETCYEGAFMQIFQPLEPEDFTLVKDIPATTSASASAYCDTFSGKRRDACHRESWPLFKESLDEPSGLETFCSLAIDAPSKRRCYNAMFYVLTAQYNFDRDRIIQLCKNVPSEREGQCFANSSSRLLETDYRLIPNAVALCSVADAEGVGGRCYKELLFYSWFNFHKDSDAFNALCKALPEPWGSMCFNGEGNMLSPSKDDP